MTAPKTRVVACSPNRVATAARVHLLLDPWEWLDTGETMRWVMDAFKQGTFAEGQ